MTIESMDPLSNSFPFAGEDEIIGEEDVSWVPEGHGLAAKENDDDKSNDDDAVKNPSNNTTTTTTPMKYNSRKPNWWKRLSNTKATKAQRRAMQEMDVHRFQRPDGTPYGQRIADWDEVFEPLQLLEDDDDDDNDGNNHDRKDQHHQRQVWIEVGCGRGENLLALAHQYRDDPTFSCIGAEIHHNGLGTMFTRLQQAKERQAYWTGYTSYGDMTYDNVQSNNSPEESPALNRDEWSPHNNQQQSEPYRHVRIFRGDGMKLITLHLPDNCVSRILVTFPDPFPKENEEPWRLFQQDTVREFHRVLNREGFLCLATDHNGFFEWSLKIMGQSKHDIGLWEQQEQVDRLKWLPAVSSYEYKGWKEGRQTFLAVWKAIKTT